MHNAKKCFRWRSLVYFDWGCTSVQVGQMSDYITPVVILHTTSVQHRSHLFWEYTDHSLGQAILLWTVWGGRYQSYSVSLEFPLIRMNSWALSVSTRPTFCSDCLSNQLTLFRNIILHRASLSENVPWRTSVLLLSLPKNIYSHRMILSVLDYKCLCELFSPFLSWVNFRCICFSYVSRGCTINSLVFKQYLWIAYYIL